MHSLAQRVWDFPRSITGNGVRDTLKVFSEYLPGLEVHEVESGTEVLDWVVPLEWNLTRAYLVGPNGERIIDSADSNVHVVSYSEPVDLEIDFDSLQAHLHCWVTPCSTAIEHHFTSSFGVNKHGVEGTPNIC